MSPTSIAIGLVAASTAVAVQVARSFRWQSVLRGFDLRLPIRPSVAGFLGADGLALLTPLRTGVLLRPVLATGGIRASTLKLLAIDHGTDVAALALLLWGLRAPVPRPLLLLLGSLVLASLVLPSPPPAPGAPHGPTRLVRTWAGNTLVAVLVWGAAFAVLALAATVAGGCVHSVWVDLAGTMAATFVAWVPLATGLAAPQGSAGNATACDPRVMVGLIQVFVLTTLPLAVLAIGFALARWLRLRRRREGFHFDDIAPEYLDQWSPHVWALLLERRMRLLTGAIGTPSQAGRGLDLGCGLGHQCVHLRERGYDVIGIDPAVGLLRHARSRGAPVLTGSALTLPLGSSCVDFVYSIGVLHHLPDPAAQSAALREVARVLRPGGVLVVQESNTLNPLFRFYMSYLFPLLKTIDEGIEWWIPPTRWSSVPDFQLERVDHFTFLPDFIPRGLMDRVLPLERRLEQGSLRRYSVHYMAVLRRTAASPVGRAA